MSTFVVSASGEVLAIRRNREEKLIVQGILLELVCKVALQVVSDLGRVDGLDGIGARVDYHASGLGVGAHSHVP